MAAQGFDYSTIRLLHENLCLDFVNSASTHLTPQDAYLRTYADLVSWGQDVGLVSNSDAQRLAALANAHPANAAAVYEQAVTLREAIYRILLAVIHSQTPEPRDMDTLNAALTAAKTHMRLVPTDTGYGWQFETGSLDAMLWQVAWSAGELLQSNALASLRQCEGCEWIFIDTSRNHSRRWCDMRTCGNRAKARRFYGKARGE